MAVDHGGKVSALMHAFVLENAVPHQVRNQAVEQKIFRIETKAVLHQKGSEQALLALVQTVGGIHGR